MLDLPGHVGPVFFILSALLAGPIPLPLTTKTLPGAIDPLGNIDGRLLPAFITLVMAGVAESCAVAAEVSSRNNANGMVR